ncbi:MAG: CPBP family intramembrane metalloprotease [Candidatus Sulfobium sp.]|jgi:membrane protease YdiL (CAAX protease family)
MAYPARRLLVLVFLTEGTALVLALLLARWFGMELFPLTRDFRGDIIGGTLAALPPLALFICSLSKRAGRVPVLRSLRRKVLKEIRLLFLDVGATELVLISVSAGFAEELLFRGVLQTEFGIVAASIIFGLIHFVSPAYAVAATLMGFYIGCVFQISGHLLMPVQLHFIYDLGALAYIRYFPSADEIDVKK